MGVPSKEELQQVLRECERKSATEEEFRQRISELDIAKGLDFDVDWREANRDIPAYAAIVNVYTGDLKLLYQL